MPRAPLTSSDTAAASIEHSYNLYNLFVGTSGWDYPTWKPGFYPGETRRRTFLSYYASQLSSVEVNYTFRKLPTALQVQTWLDATPAGFRFAFKAPQRITHFQRLLNCNETVAGFVSVIAPPRSATKLGPVLFQLPPNFAADNARLSAFLELPALEGRSLQLAFEFRNPTWFSESTYTILRRHNAAMCIAESDDLKTPEVATADFRYYRLRCNGGYKPKQLKAFAERFTSMASACEVYAYLKHEDEPTGALNAKALLKAAASKAGSR